MDFEIIVVGGGHAGVEASYISSKMGMKVLLVTLNKKMIANMPCNPHIGGSAKGVVVREIDALGGLMGIAADHHPLQMKLLNTGKGPGVQCLRSQQDKVGYPAYVQEVLDKQPNLTILEEEVVSLLYEDKKVYGVKLKNGKEITSKAVIITTGTYLNGQRIRGEEVVSGGPDGEKASIGLSEALQEMGIDIFRLKTGTPPRLAKETIDFSNAIIQEGSDEKLCFSYRQFSYTPLKDQLPCYLIYTSPKTLQIIQENLQKSALFNGIINSAGPRYCPSIESKIVRFADKERHQLFLEPEFEHGNSIYLQGFSTGMPKEIQEEMVHSLPGLEKAKILKYAYQIEYDAIRPLQFDETLRIKKFEGLYGAGQICGTSGYEEAAGLGLMAGINACLWIQNKGKFVLKRNEAYIGVMIDDLVTKGTEEPYRLLSSRAEFRLLLRNDNADYRLMDKGYELGLISEEEYKVFKNKYSQIDEVRKILETTIIDDKEGLARYFEENEYVPADKNYGFKGLDILKRPHFEYRRIRPLIRALDDIELSDEQIMSLETSVKYEGYIKNQEKEALSILKQDDMPIPEDIDYLHMDGLRLEARSKLDSVRPSNIGLASRISGVNPADISVLILNLKKMKNGKK